MKHNTSAGLFAALLVAFAIPAHAQSQSLRSAGTDSVGLRLRNFDATSAAPSATGGRRFIVHAVAIAELEVTGSVKVVVERAGGDSIDLSAAGCGLSNTAVRKAKSEGPVTSELSCEIEVPKSVTIVARASVSRGGEAVRVILEATPVP